MNEGYGIYFDWVFEYVVVVDLVVMVDCGVFNFDEVKLLLVMGIEVVVIDYYVLGENFFECLVVYFYLMLDYDFDCYNLIGVGVVYYLLWVVYEELGRFELCVLLLLVMLGMVVDVVLLLGENCVLVCVGLVEMVCIELFGLCVLMNEKCVW